MEGLNSELQGFVVNDWEDSFVSTTHYYSIIFKNIVFFIWCGYSFSYFELKREL